MWCAWWDRVASQISQTYFPEHFQAVDVFLYHHHRRRVVTQWQSRQNKKKAYT
jgi:hypothetical protein